ncbi:hypothetical protein ScPMuIL_013356 [Solemya velum]
MFVVIFYGKTFSFTLIHTITDPLSHSPTHSCPPTYKLIVHPGSHAHSPTQSLTLIQWLTYSLTHPHTQLFTHVLSQSLTNTQSLSHSLTNTRNHSLTHNRSRTHNRSPTYLIIPNTHNHSHTPSFTRTQSPSHTPTQYLPRTAPRPSPTHFLAHPIILSSINDRSDRYSLSPTHPQSVTPHTIAVPQALIHSLSPPLPIAKSPTHNCSHTRSLTFHPINHLNTHTHYHSPTHTITRPLTLTRPRILAQTHTHSYTRTLPNPRPQQLIHLHPKPPHTHSQPHLPARPLIHAKSECILRDMSLSCNDDDDGFAAKELLDRANGLLYQCGHSFRVQTVTEIDVSFFLTLFEELSGERVPESMRIMTCYDDECRLCDDIIGFLSNDILHVSFSHISGRQVASGNFRAIGDFLELFSELFTIVDKPNATNAQQGDNGDDLTIDMLESLPDNLRSVMRQLEEVGQDVERFSREVNVCPDPSSHRRNKKTKPRKDAATQINKGSKNPKSSQMKSGARTKPVWKDVRFLPRNNSSPQVVKAPTTKYSARYRSSSVQAETKPQRKRIPSRREINAPVTKGNRQPIIATKVRRHSATDGTCSKAKPATQHDTRRTQILTKVPMPRKPKLSASRSLASKTTIRNTPHQKSCVSPETEGMCRSLRMFDHFDSIKRRLKKIKQERAKLDDEEAQKSFNESCSFSCECDMDDGLVCTADGSCQCGNYMLEYWDSGCKTKIYNGLPCELTSQCRTDLQLVCFGDRQQVCQCPSGMYFGESLLLPQCVNRPSVGEPCSDSVPCETGVGLTCVVKKKIQFCGCDQNYQWDKNVMSCHKSPSFGEPCSNSLPCKTGVGLSCAGDKETQFCGCDQNYQWDEDVMSCQRSPSFDEPCSNSFPCKTGVGLTCAGEKETQFCGCDQNYQWHEDAMSCQKSPSFDEQCSNSLPCKTGVGLSCAGEKETQFCGCDENYQWDKDVMSCQKSPSFDEQCSNSLPCKTGVGLSCAGDKETQFCGCGQNYQWDETALSCQENSVVDIEMIAVASSGVLVFLIVLVFVTIVVIKKRKDFRNLDCCCTETPKDVQPPLDIPQYASLHLNISGMISAAAQSPIDQRALAKVDSVVPVVGPMNQKRRGLT